MNPYCPRCGGPLDDRTGACATCALGAAFLEETIQRSDRACASCGARLDAEARYCPRCGVQASAAGDATGDPVREALEAQLGGQYRILRLLGRGGMGAVYLARDLTLEREVAIKVVKPGSDPETMYDRFRREAKTAARLSHPNIVPLHAFGNVNGMPYFVMGFVRGESLAERMRREGKLPEDEARRILAEVADALDHAHREGIVHRDVKPDNVLLEDATGRALLTDFGIARSVQESGTLTHQGMVLGTPQYMSPEQASGRSDIDGRSDLYSLGVMGYAMVSGRLPFDGATTAEVLTKHLTQEPAPLRSLAPLVSDSTQQAIERCLAKDPSKRWPDARSFRTTLGTVDDGLPDAVESLRGQGVAFALISAFLLGLAWMIVFRRDGAPIGVMWLIAGTFVAGYIAVLADLRSDGFGVRLIQRVVWSEPSWWPFWYPRPLRRPFNVWDRLPPLVRALRASSVVLVVWFVFTALNAGEYLFVTVAFLLLAGVMVLEWLTKRDLKRRGIQSSYDLNRVALSAPPSRARFWMQPSIEAVLAPKEPSDPARTDSPNDHFRMIIRMGDELAGPLRPLGTEAAVAARRLLASIEGFEKQIADLARNVDAGEEQRLEEKIAALGGAAEGAPMRDLLEKQLELIRSMEARIEVAKANRSRHAEMLKTLALHMTALRAKAMEAPSKVGSLSDDVRALCGEIGGQAARNGEAPTVVQSR